MSETSEPVEDTTDFMVALEKGIRDVLKNRKTKPSEKVAAISAGAKLLMVKFKISGNDEDNFFK